MTRSPVACRPWEKCWCTGAPYDAGFSTFSKVSDYGQCVKKCLWLCPGLANETSEVGSGRVLGIQQQKQESGNWLPLHFKKKDPLKGK